MEGERLRRRTRFAQLSLIFALIGLAFTAPTLMQHLAEGLAVPWDRLLSELLGWFLWALYVPVVLWTVRCFPLDRQSWQSRLLIYFGIGVAVALSYAVLDVLKSSLLSFAIAGRFVPNLFKLGPGYLLGGVEFYLLVYAAMLAVVQAFEYHRRYQDRELKTSRLEAQLTKAQLEVLRVQLNPHFLFNTLNAISALMHKDVDAADRMIVQLSDFLRLTLEGGTEQQVTLAQELDILERYLEIEKTRFGSRLAVRLQVDPEVLDAQVPSLILQPLVENAIRHGVSVRSLPGEIEVLARPQFPDKLELRVLDNGPGLQGKPERLLRPGVGLHNTMARLEQLYGKAQRFELGNAPSGGFMVTLTFPLRHLSEEEPEIADAGAAPARVSARDNRSEGSLPAQARSFS